jgi:hypothetical protein
LSGGDLFYMLERFRMISCFGYYEFKVHQYTYPFLVNYKYLFDRLDDPYLCDTYLFVDKNQCVRCMVSDSYDTDEDYDVKSNRQKSEIDQYEDEDDQRED